MLLTFHCCGPLVKITWYKNLSQTFYWNMFSCFKFSLLCIIDKNLLMEKNSRSTVYNWKYFQLFWRYQGLVGMLKQNGGEWRQSCSKGVVETSKDWPLFLKHLRKISTNNVNEEDQRDNTSQEEFAELTVLEHKFMPPSYPRLYIHQLSQTF